MEEIDFHDCRIQKLFQDFYIIPDYQREYVWEEKQVNQLLNDIYEQFSGNPDAEYFLGTIVICKHRTTNKHEVIDGQQRLITLSLLLNSFRRLLKENSREVGHIVPLLYSVTSDAKGNAISSNILDIEYEGKNVLYDLYKTDRYGEINYNSIEGKPGKTIYDAHEVIESFLKETFTLPRDIEEFAHFLGYILNKVKVIQIATPELSSALKIFETINERGIGLDDVDLLKNLLFMQVDRKDFIKLKTDWGKFKKSIQGEREKEKPLRFLRYFIMANYTVEPDDKGSKIVREDNVYAWFVNNEKKCNYIKNSFTFVRKLQENANFYMGLIENKFHGQKNLSLENISFLVGKASKQHYILLLAAINLKPKQLEYFAGHLESLLFYYVITNEPSRDVEKKFAEWAQEIQRISDDKSLEEFIKSRFSAEMQNKATEFRTDFKNLGLSVLQKFKLKYILAKIIQFVEKERSGGCDESLEPYLKKNIHIEHILPEEQNKVMMKVAFKDDSKEYDLYKRRIGNLTLLEEPINTSVQNKEYEKKKEDYKKSKYYLNRSMASIETVGNQTAVNRINKQLRSFNKWGPDEIDDRCNMLLEIAMNIWKV